MTEIETYDIPLDDDHEIVVHVKDGLDLTIPIPTLSDIHDNEPGGAFPIEAFGEDPTLDPGIRIDDELLPIPDNWGWGPAAME